VGETGDRLLEEGEGPWAQLGHHSLAQPIIRDDRAPVLRIPCGEAAAGGQASAKVRGKPWVISLHAVEAALAVERESGVDEDVGADTVSATLSNSGQERSGAAVAHQYQRSILRQRRNRLCHRCDMLPPARRLLLSVSWSTGTTVSISRCRNSSATRDQVRGPTRGLWTSTKTSVLLAVITSPVPERRPHRRNRTVQARCPRVDWRAPTRSCGVAPRRGGRTRRRPTPCGCGRYR